MASGKVATPQPGSGCALASGCAVAPREFRTAATPPSAQHIHLVWAALVLAAGALLFSITINRFALALRVIEISAEREYGEAIIYAQAHRILNGDPLYQPLDQPPYTVVAYTPLYYGLAAGLQLAAGSGWVPGRVVSYIAALVTAALVGYITRRATDDVRPGLLAAVLFLALGFPGRTDPWYALYKEDLLGVALSVTAIALLISDGARRYILLSAILAALAFLTKQTFVAAALAGTICLLRRDRVRARAYIVVYLTIVLGTVTTLEVISQAFIANTVVANMVPFSTIVLEPGLRVLLQFQAGSLLIAAVCTFTRWWAGCRPQDELIYLYWACSFLPLVGLAKIGSNSNYWIELAASTAVLASIGVWEARQWPWLRGAAAPLPACVLLTSVVVALRPLGLPAVPLLNPPQAELPDVDLGPLIEQIRSEPGPVLADPLDVVALAGKDILFEPYLFGILHTEGRWNPEPLIRQICDGEIKLVVLGRALGSAPANDASDGWAYQGYSFWLPPVLEEALRESMSLDASIGDRFLYRPTLSQTTRGRGVCMEPASGHEPEGSH
jgi:hypothetical protein